jgi:hypothetical protein
MELSYNLPDNIADTFDSSESVEWQLDRSNSFCYLVFDLVRGRVCKFFKRATLPLFSWFEGARSFDLAPSKVALDTKSLPERSSTGSSQQHIVPK